MFWKKNKKDNTQAIETSQDELELEQIIANANDDILDEPNENFDKSKATLEANKHIEEKKGNNNKSIAEYLKQMQNFESDRVAFIKNQNKLLIRGCILLSLITVSSLIAFANVYPLKTVVPYLIRVDNATGELDIVNPLANGKDTYDEKLNRFWIQQYVTLRESYYWSTLEDSLGRMKLLSTDSVFRQYETVLYGVNSPLKQFKNTRSVKVQIKGTTFFENDGKVFAQTRLSKTIIDNAGKPVDIYPVTHWVATSTFDYKKEIKRANEEFVNPLGFEITSYRIDPVKD
ncbi:virB8 family protein [Photobacterium damselae]|uniref:virB8 family protein n=1 Tax=Photobacterium damselae TaxID=38293 RepID=UPI0010FECE3E|nr:type IV secretion system protein [Photobacterium damselae]TLS73431.1 hypothetical protein FD718_01945 [Photobacterium damselae subsp. damselae]